MSEQKSYTAQEMREYADAMAGDFIDSNHNPVEIIYDAGIVIIECLRQAAETRERACAVIAKAKKANETQTSFGCRTCVENYIKEINYILKGETDV